MFDADSEYDPQDAADEAADQAREEARDLEAQDRADFRELLRQINDARWVALHGKTEEERGTAERAFRMALGELVRRSM